MFKIFISNPLSAISRSGNRLFRTVMPGARSTLVVRMWDLNRNEQVGRARRAHGRVAGGAAADASLDTGRGAGAAEWVRTALGFSADAMQQQVLRSGQQRGLLNCTRQWGKSTVTAAKAIHQAYHFPETLTLVVSPSARQTGEFLRKAAGFARKLGIRPKGDGDNEISLELPNRSRIVGLPGSEATVRGMELRDGVLGNRSRRERHRGHHHGTQHTEPKPE